MMARKVSVWMKSVGMNTSVYPTGNPIFPFFVFLFYFLFQGKQYWKLHG